jgi:endonuclease/exonuclease/phosphatase family metal-dependent hydrolase
MNSPAPTCVSVVNYNVLALHLYTNKRYMNGAISREDRLAGLKERIRAMLADGSIICLHEVDRHILTCLRPLFNALAYVLIVGPYFTSRCYGSVVAVPSNIYSIKDQRFELVGNHIRIPGNADCTPPPPPPPPPNNRSTRKPLASEVLRDNVMICVALVDKATNAEFCIATYHMPCAFWWKSVMILHADTFMARVAHYAQSRPVIISGDFNMTPTGSDYAALFPSTRQCSSGQNPLHLDDAQAPYVGWEPSRFKLDVINVAVRHMPTTWVQNQKGVHFKEQIDHIFMSTHWTCVKFDNKGPVAPMPHLGEPSDHLPIRAVLRLLVV